MPNLSTNGFFSRIKKAYRRKALELHPDRNIGDTENATQRFAEVQAAYEVLSDPQERAWYDSHREAILRGHDPESHPSGFYDSGLTSTEDIFSLIRHFNSTVPFSDEPTGFFTIARETFEQLAVEEAAALGPQDLDAVEYPNFGTSTDEYGGPVKRFYGGWSSFSTRKTFGWKDKYRLSDAPDRRVRRLMEKENKKLRDDAIREFNDAVRFFVVFVRKRDPRYTPNTQTDADRQRSLRDAAAAQAARARAANQEKLADAVVADWAQARQDGDGDATNAFSASEEEESEMEQIECVVCNKTFKSEKQFETHEKSKKHLRAIQQLRRQMKREDISLDLVDSTVEDSPLENTVDDKVQNGGVVVPQLLGMGSLDSSSGKNDYPLAKSEGPPGSEKPGEDTEDDVAHSSSELSDDDGYVAQEKLEERLFADKASARGPVPQGDSGGSDDGLHRAVENMRIEDLAPPKKPGMAKAKRQKKAARQVASTQVEVEVSLRLRDPETPG